jgi:hypothetical protein
MQMNDRHQEKKRNSVMVGIVAASAFLMFLLANGIAWGFDVIELAIAFVAVVSGAAFGLAVWWQIIGSGRDDE